MFTTFNCIDRQCFWNFIPPNVYSSEIFQPKNERCGEWRASRLAREREA